jgi:hypothetical protein
MQSGKKPVNCTPCAKRKVRCDRSQPCGHCKRRKGDACVYLTQHNRGLKTRPDESSEHIAKLENYIRRLGGDLSLLEQTSTAGEANLQQAHTSTLENENINIEPGSLKVHRKINSKRQGLVEHDEQVTYTEM